MMTHKSNDAKTYYNRGMVYYKEREYDKAIGAFSEVIKRDPNHAEAYYNRGNAYKDCDGTYVLTAEALEESDKVKPFEHFIDDLKQVIAENQ